MKKWLGLLILLLINSGLFAQDEYIDALVDSLIRKNGVKQMRIDLRTIGHGYDTTYWTETRYFDDRGNMTENIAPKPWNKFERRVYQYDSLDREILYREYDPSDTTRFHTERRWFYKDSTNYKTELHSNGKLASYKEYETKISGDTTWIIENEFNVEYSTKYRKISRYRKIGDSILVSEYIGFDDNMKLSGVDTYYDIKRDLDTGYLIEQGEYRVKDSEWEQFYKDENLMRDYYNNPEKYLQMQLDGAFEMEYSLDPFTYEIYNYDGQLLQDGYGLLKSTLEYNEAGQLIKFTGWGENKEERYGPLVEDYFRFYTYDESGLPISIESKDLNRGTRRIIQCTYSF